MFGSGDVATSYFLASPLPASYLFLMLLDPETLISPIRGEPE